MKIVLSREPGEDHQDRQAAEPDGRQRGRTAKGP